MGVGRWAGLHLKQELKNICQLLAAYAQPQWSSGQACVHAAQREHWSRAVVLNLCYSDAFELQLPETPVRTAGGEGFWELQSKTPE